MYRINMYLETRISGVKAARGWCGYLIDYVDENGNQVKDDEKKFGYVNNVTKNQLSLTVMIGALKRVDGPGNITVYTDSLYLRGNFENNLQTWKEAGWKNSKGETVKNKELWEELERLSRPYTITFSKEHHHSYKNWMVAVLERKGN